VDNLWGPTGTIIIHVLVFIVLLNFMTVQKRAAETEIEVVIKEIETFEDLEEMEDELEELEDIPTVVDAVAPPTVSVEAEPPVVDSVSTSDSVDMSQFDVLEAVSPLTFKGLYASRTASGREGALKRFGGGMGQRTEYAVMKALRWLKTHQYPDGSWGPHYRASMTGLALLALLAHGETTSSPEFGQAIQKGLKYLLKKQDGKGVFRGGGPHHRNAQPATRGQLISYEHSIATYAISEAYGLTKIPYLRPAMEEAVQVIIDGQHSAGSWDYGYEHGPEAQMDVSLSGWHIQALKAALIAGADNRGLKAAIENSMNGLKALWSKKESMFLYSTRAEEAPNASMTGVAVLCMQLVGHALDDEARGGMTSLRNFHFRWTKGDAPNEDKRGVGPWPFYAWYYITQARFHQGSRAWVTWNKEFAPALCRVQNRDGSWCPAPETVEQKFGPVYCTSLGALMLEVYYRFLPTYKPIEVDTGEAVDDETDEEDIVIKFGQG